MAVAPSNNLLTALSQLQGPRPSAAAQRPTASAQPPAGAQGVQGGFAAQLAGTVQAAAPVQSKGQVAAAQPPAAQGQQPPIPTRGGYLGQYINIVV